MKLRLIAGILGLAVLVIVYQNVSASSSIVNVGQGGANYVPSALTITQGDAVNWIWVSGFHSTTSGSCSPSCAPDGKWDSGQHAPVFNFGVTFNSPGTFPYYCSVHGAAMQGTITVNARPAEVPEADSMVLVLNGGAGLALYLGLKWRAHKSYRDEAES